MTDSPTSRAEDTRRNLLMAAFVDFYRNGFQGGSLNRIVEAAGMTKGALFHHFAGKQELGYAVVEEVIAPLLFQRWLDPVKGSDDPIGAIQAAFRTYIQVDIESGSWAFGCPMNNLAQEMSPLDAGFRSRLDSLYARWRTEYAVELARAQAEGKVRNQVDPEQSAALIVATQMGIWGTGKCSQDERLMVQAGEAICSYLEGLRAT